MTIFAVVVSKEPEKMKAAILAKFAVGSFYEVDSSFWLVDSTFATAKEFAQFLGPNNEIGTYISFPITSYYGFHSKVVWEWLSSKGV